MDIVADMDFAEMDAEKQYRIMYAECLGDRPGANALLLWMESAGFFTAPASARHHLNTPGGLCRHTINVAMNASDLCNTPAFMNVDTKEAMVAALLHDLCKIGKYRAGDNGSTPMTTPACWGTGRKALSSHRISSGYPTMKCWQSAGTWARTAGSGTGTRWARHTMPARWRCFCTSLI